MSNEYAAPVAGRAIMRSNKGGMVLKTVQRLQAKVYGRVQGVNFRYYTQLTATQLGVVGWVRNLADGSVEVMAEGARDSLDKLLAFLRQGPPAAHVNSIDVEWREPSGEFRDFQVR
jgi:acylphosphatase